MKLNKQWLKEHTSKIHFNNEDIREDIISGKVKQPRGGFTSSITEEGKKKAEQNILKSFDIFIPGRGWAVCRT